MNIEEFFAQSAGKWFAHRTSQNLAPAQSQEAKSEIIIETLAANHADVVKLCEQHQINPGLASCGAKVNWNDVTKLNQKNVGSTVLVFVPDASDRNQGTLLRQTGTATYSLGSDEALTFTIQDGNTTAEERLWFASPNLRLRASVIKHAGNISQTTFTTEIRMGAAPASAITTQSATASS